MNRFCLVLSFVFLVITSAGFTRTAHAADSYWFEFTGVSNIMCGEIYVPAGLQGGWVTFDVDRSWSLPDTPGGNPLYRTRDVNGVVYAEDRPFFTYTGIGSDTSGTTHPVFRPSVFGGLVYRPVYPYTFTLTHIQYVDGVATSFSSVTVLCTELGPGKFVSIISDRDLDEDGPGADGGMK